MSDIGALKFGPEWMRDLTAVSSSSSQTHSSGPASIRNSRQPPPAADRRYSRKEMVSLCTRVEAPPDCLYNDPLCAELDSTQPLIFTPQSQEEQRSWQRSVNSEKAVRLQSNSGGLPGGGGSVSGGNGGRGGGAGSSVVAGTGLSNMTTLGTVSRGRGLERGRGRPRGSGQQYPSRGHSYEEDSFEGGRAGSLRESFAPPGLRRGGALGGYERSTSLSGGMPSSMGEGRGGLGAWGVAPNITSDHHSSSYHHQLGALAGDRNSLQDERVGSPRKELPGRASVDNWRSRDLSASSAVAGTSESGVVQQDHWRAAALASSGPLLSGGRTGQDKWGSNRVGSNGWRPRDPLDDGYSNSSYSYSSRPRGQQLYYHNSVSRARQPWDAGSSSRRSFKDDDWPEWANDQDPESSQGGSFDSSGAFHGSSWGGSGVGDLLQPAYLSSNRNRSKSGSLDPASTSSASNSDLPSSTGMQNISGTGPPTSMSQPVSSRGDDTSAVDPKSDYNNINGTPSETASQDSAANKLTAETRLRAVQLTEPLQGKPDIMNGYDETVHDISSPISSEKLLRDSQVLSDREESHHPLMTVPGAPLQQTLTSSEGTQNFHDLSSLVGHKMAPRVSGLSPSGVSSGSTLDKQHGQHISHGQHTQHSMQSNIILPHQIPLRQQSLIANQSSTLERKADRDREDELALMQSSAADLVSKLVDEELKTTIALQPHPLLTNSLQMSILPTSDPPAGFLPLPAHGPRHEVKDNHQWYYRDPQHEVQGPFPASTMATWYESGYFSDDLLLRRDCDDKFAHLGDLKKVFGRVPFLPGPPVPPLKVSQLLDPHKISDVTAAASTSMEHEIQQKKEIEEYERLCQSYLLEKQLYEQQMKIRHTSVLSALMRVESWDSFSPSVQQQLYLQQMLLLPPLPEPVPPVRPSFILAAAAAASTSSSSSPSVSTMLKQLTPAEVGRGGQQLSRVTPLIQEAPKPMMEAESARDPIQDLVQQMSSVGAVPKPNATLQKSNPTSDIIGGIPPLLHQPHQQSTTPTIPLLQQQQVASSIPLPTEGRVIEATVPDENPLQQLLMQLQRGTNNSAPVTLSGSSSVLQQLPAPPPSPASTAVSSEPVFSTGLQYTDLVGGASKNVTGQPEAQDEDVLQSFMQTLSHMRQTEAAVVVTDPAQLQTSKQQSKVEQERKKLDTKSKKEQEEMAKKHQEDDLKRKEEQKRREAEEDHKRKVQAAEVKRKEEEKKGKQKNKHQEEANRRQEEKRRQQEEESKKRAEEKKREQEAREAETELRRQQVRQEADLRRQQQQEIELRRQQQEMQRIALEEERRRMQQQAWGAVTAVNGVGGSGDQTTPSLVEIQKLQQEKDKLEKERVQKEEEARRAEQIREATERKKAAPMQLKWASKLQGSSSGVKSLLQIQAEEEKELKKRVSREQQENKATVAAATAAHVGASTPAALRGWTGQQMSWASRASPNTAPPPTTPVASKGWNEGPAVTAGGFWECESKPVAKTAAAAVAARPAVKQAPATRQQPGKPAPKSAAAVVAATKLTTKLNHNNNFTTINNNNNKVPVATRKKGRDDEAPKRLLIENATLSPSDEFRRWCYVTMEALKGDVDVPTFVNFLRDVESPYEVHDYIRNYLGDTREVKEFAKSYLERRSKMINATRQRSVTTDDILAPAPAVNPGCETFQDGKNRKQKNKKKLQKSESGVVGLNTKERFNGDVEYH